MNKWARLSDSGLDYHACMNIHCMPGAMYPLANFPDTPERSRLLGGYQVHDHAEVTPLAQTKPQLPFACHQTLWCTLLSVSFSLQPHRDPLPQSSRTYFSGPISFFRVSPPAKGICPNLQPVQARTKDGSYHFHTAVPGIWACGAPPFSLKRLNCLGVLGTAWAGPGAAIILHYLTPLPLKRAWDCPSLPCCSLLHLITSLITSSLQRDHNWGVSNPAPHTQPGCKEGITLWPGKKGTGCVGLPAQVLWGCCREGQGLTPESLMAFASPVLVLCSPPSWPQTGISNFPGCRRYSLLPCFQNGQAGLHSQSCPHHTA